jgi:hypothetical protein
MTARHGYIMVEALVALALLSISVMAINRALGQALVVRAVAQDWTHARFMLDQVMAPVELQPVMVEGTRSGNFGEHHARFSWEITVEKVDLPLPPLPPELPEPMVKAIEDRLGYMGKVTARITWTRARQPYEAVAVTMIPQNRLWQPREELMPLGPPQS